MLRLDNKIGLKIDLNPFSRKNIMQHILFESH